MNGKRTHRWSYSQLRKEYLKVLEENNRLLDRLQREQGLEIVVDATTVPRFKEMEIERDDALRALQMVADDTWLGGPEMTNCRRPNEMVEKYLERARKNRREVTL